MLKIVFKRILTYFFYLFFSFGVGYMSLMGKSDYVGELSRNIIPIMMTLMALYGAISGQLISRLVNADLKKEELKMVIDAMERNIVIEAFLLLFSFSFLAAFSWILSLTEDCGCFACFLKLFKNALICFDFMYFVYVVYDSIVGLYHLLKNSPS